MSTCMARLFCGLLLLLAGTTAHAAEPEKFALLIGVNAQQQTADYPVPVLQGPGNDVVLIRHLLTTRYGFKDDADHIRVLTGKDATHKGIADAFRSQLVEKARLHPRATVVFYFSGHGSTTRDLNGDEGDGIDETLVAYDSRGPNGRDIVDDEVDDWLESLRHYTSNVTFILDSCHSQSATRGDIARSLPPNPHMPAPLASRDADADPTPHLLRNRQYTAISGALANELSYEGDIAAAGGKRHGYLTWYLVQTLDRRPYLSWHQAINEIQQGVATVAPQQHPQVEGDEDRNAFGGADDRQLPYIAIKTVEPGGGITVAAGMAQGVRDGTLLAIYAPDAKALAGDTGKIANATVTAAGVGFSRAQILGDGLARIPLDAKVAILTPYFGTAPLGVKLDALPDQPSDPRDAPLLAAVRTRLRDNSLVASAAQGGAWTFAVQRGCLGTGNLLTPATDAKPPSGCRAAYYLADRQTRAPALGFSVSADDITAAAKVADAVAALARQASLRALTNAGSPLRVQLRLVKVSVRQNAAGELEVVGSEPAPKDEVASVRLGDYYTFDVANDSDQDVYAALLDLGTSGSIRVMSPSANGELIRASGVMRLKPPLRAGPPTGLETYKIVAATRSDIDFHVMEAPGTSKAPNTSPLEWYLAQASSIGAKDGQAATGVQESEWVTSQLDIVMRPAAMPAREGNTQ